MENEEKPHVGPKADDDSRIWRFIYNKKIREKSDEPIDSNFFKEFCEDVDYGPEQAYRYYMTVMIGDLYKEPGLEPYEILELYKKLKIRMSVHQLETLEKYCTVFLKLNSQRILVSWSLPRYEAVKRAYEPPETDHQPKKRCSPVKIERQDSEDSQNLPEAPLPDSEVVGGSRDAEDVQDPIDSEELENSGDAPDADKLLNMNPENSGDYQHQNPFPDSEFHARSPEFVIDSEEFDGFSQNAPDSEEHVGSVISVNSGEEDLPIQNPLEVVADSEVHARSHVKQEVEDVEVNMEEVEIVEEIRKNYAESDEDGDVTIEKVVPGDVEVPDDVEQKMWEYIGKNFEKNRPTRFLTCALWEVFRNEKLNDATLTSGQLINHFTRNLLPKLWNHRMPIESRLQILQATRMPITKDQRNFLEKEFKLRITLSQLSCVEQWSTRSASESTPPRLRIRVLSDSEVDEDDDAPTTTPKTASSPALPICKTPRRKITIDSEDSDEDVPRTPSIQKSAHSVGRRPTPDPLTGKRRRSFYTPGDDRSMWKFLLEEARNGSEVKPKGLEIWKRYIDKTDCWREPANLASHYIRYMVPRLHLTDLPLADKLKLYMTCEISCPPPQIRRFREEYLINHQELIITFAKKITEAERDKDSEDDDEKDLEDAPENSESLEIVRAPESSGEVIEAPEYPDIDEKAITLRRSSRISGRLAKLRDSPESRAASETPKNNQRPSEKSPESLPFCHDADTTDNELLIAINANHKTGNRSETITDLVREALGAAFQKDQKLDLEKITTAITGNLQQIIEKAKFPAFRMEIQHILQHLVSVLSESAPESQDAAEKLIEATCQKLMLDLKILEQ